MSRSSSTYQRRNKDLAKIHILKKELVEDGLLTEDGYRSMIAAVQHRLGIAQRRDKPSAADLNARGRKELLQSFDILKSGRKNAPTIAPAPTTRYVGNGERGDDGYHLTQGQADYIAHLEDELGWTDDPGRIVGFIERQIGKRKSPSMLRNSEATTVITGLKEVAGISTRPHRSGRNHA